MISLNERFPDLASHKECTGCMACLSICPKGAIRQVTNMEGHTAVELDTEKCVRCLRCEKICIGNKKNYGSNCLDETTVYCGWAQEEDFRKEGTSGGVFAAMAATVLADKGIVFGASFDGKHCIHIGIDRIEDIPKLQKSKYTQSSIINVYQEIGEALPYRKVLFTGTGCQVGAILEYYKDNKYIDNLYTMDLVCGGVPSSALIERFLENNPSIESIATFRSKDHYELSVYKNGCAIPIREKSLPLQGYACGMTNRYCCYDCKYAYPHRKCDVTVGDLWNYDLYPEEHAKGISMILSHTVKGKELLNHASIELYPTEWKDVLYTNKRIVYGKEKIFLPRLYLAKNLRSMSYARFERIYCMKMKPWHINEYLFKIYRHFVIKFQEEKIRRYIHSILK